MFIEWKTFIECLTTFLIDMIMMVNEYINTLLRHFGDNAFSLTYITNDKMIFLAANILPLLF